MGCFAHETCNLWVASFVLKIHRLTLWDTFVVVLCWCLYLWPKNSCWCAFALSLPSYCRVLPGNVTSVSLTEHDKQILALKRLDSLWIRNSKTSRGVNIVTCRSWMNQLFAIYYSLKNELHHFTMYSTQKMQHFFYFAQLCFNKSSARTPIILHLTGVEVENNTLRFQLAFTNTPTPRFHATSASRYGHDHPCYRTMWHPKQCSCSHQLHHGPFQRCSKKWLSMLLRREYRPRLFLTEVDSSRVKLCTEQMEPDRKSDSGMTQDIRSIQN